MKKEEQVLKGFRDLLNKMIWLNSLKMKDCFEDYKSSEVHCIEYIGHHEDSNVTKLAEAFYVTRGAISKMTKKLIAKGAVECYRKPENKKEIYFRLTEQGQKIFQVHEGLHEEFQERDKAVYEGVTEEELDIMIRFAGKYNEHLAAEIQKQGINRTMDKYDSGN